MRARSRLLTAFALVGIASATACSAVLGFESFSPLPDEPEAGPDSAATVGDTSTPTTDTGGNPIDTGGGPPDADAPDVDAPDADAAPPFDGGVADADAATDADAALCVADLRNDPKHCGRCNHDCLGGTCSNSMCAPIRFLDGIAIPVGLTVDATYIYVTEYDTNHIVRVRKDAPGSCLRDVAPVPLSCVFIDQPNAFKPTAITNDGNRLYWVNRLQGTVVSCPLPGGCGALAATVHASQPESAFAHVTSALMPIQLVARDGLVFWSESGSGAIRSSQADGGSPMTYFENATFMPLAIAVDDTNIYFTDDTTSHPTQIAAVRRDGANQDGGSVRVVADSPARPFGLALSKGNVHWTVPFVAGDDGVVLSTPTSSDGGGAQKSLASNLIDPYMIIADDTNVYWLSPGAPDVATGLVLSCPLTGCPPNGPIILASNQRRPRRLTQDAEAIYWSNGGISSTDYDGQVFKVAKP